MLMFCKMSIWHRRQFKRVVSQQVNNKISRCSLSSTFGAVHAMETGEAVTHSWCALSVAMAVLRTLLHRIWVRLEQKCVNDTQWLMMARKWARPWCLNFPGCTWNKRNFITLISRKSLSINHLKQSRQEVVVLD